MNYTPEQLKAAYALNLCTVSVSQIIDYNDVNVMEQEYDAILNNLNLEQIPKDEALLKILKELLDTITYFRIEEGDKKFIDREYQQKMKNAIWAAVPNIGMIVAGGNPVTMAISLASQIGMGYMNYRKNKNEYELERDKELWQLEKTAIEQFNGLRRELFDTAWRLADAYQFPDVLRLTERQIKQYNDILMDEDLIRRYERMTTIRDNFYAYPPFWYYYGNTANAIARDNELPLSLEARMDFIRKSKDHFEQFLGSNKYNLLREDQISASCALEYVDLLDPVEDKEKIKELLDFAAGMSGNANDVLQLCMIAYLKIGEPERAEKWLRVLVNEGYNAVLNAQILSGLYVNRYLSGDTNKARRDYEVLATRVTGEVLYGLPAKGQLSDFSQLQHEFAEKQRNLLRKKYNAAIDEYFRNYEVVLGKLIPAPDYDDSKSDFYYSKEGSKQRVRELETLFYDRNRAQNYRSDLYCANFVIRFFEKLNDLFEEIIQLNCVEDEYRLQNILSSKIASNAALINDLQQKIYAEDDSFTVADFEELLSLTSVTFFDSFIRELKQQMDHHVSEMNDMCQFSVAESGLRIFCVNNHISEPEYILQETTEKKEIVADRQYFNIRLLGEEGQNIIEEGNRFVTIEEVIRRRRETLVTAGVKAAIFLYNEEGYRVYFDKNRVSGYEEIKQKVVAVYDDRNLNAEDYLFTTDGVCIIERGVVKEAVPYDEALKQIDTQGDDLQRINLREQNLRGVALTIGKSVGKSVASVFEAHSDFAKLREVFEEIVKEI